MSKKGMIQRGKKYFARMNSDPPLPVPDQVNIMHPDVLAYKDHLETHPEEPTEQKKKETFKEKIAKIFKSKKSDQEKKEEVKKLKEEELNKTIEANDISKVVQ